MPETEIVLDCEVLKVPIPLYSSSRVGSLRSRDGQVFAIFAGLDRQLVAQLKEKSLDESDLEIQNNTSDRARFGEGSYESWYEKGRVPFALVDASRNLAALTWFGPKPLGRKSLKHLSAEERSQDERLLDAGDWHTVVYRAYEPYRGKGLMKAFLKSTMDLYRTAYPQSKIWAGIYADNPASIGLVTKLGFTKLDPPDGPESHEAVMVWEADSSDA